MQKSSNTGHNKDMKFTVKTTNGQSNETIVQGNKVTVGRSNKCDVVVKDDSLSRSHCEIELEDGNFFITDMASINGVYLDGVRIPVSTRTPFNSFNQIHLATVECQVEDNELEGATNPNIKIPAGFYKSEEPTSVTRMMSQPAVAKAIKKSRSKPKPKPTSSGLNLGLITPVVLFLGVGYYFFSRTPSGPIETSTKVQAPFEVPEYKKAAEKIKATPNDFLLPSEYEQLNQAKTCSSMEELCKNLKLDNAQYEGIARNENEYVVFINPSIRLNSERYLAMKDAPDIQDLIALDLIMGSEIMNRYFTGQTNQIHVVINDPTGKNTKVFRFHPLKFVPGTAPRIKLMEELNQAFFDKNSKPFWETLGDSVFTLPLETVQ